jgi:predicted nucleotide-binding protein (sugar kinase/HSP70/actin superfamily)
VEEWIYYANLLSLRHSLAKRDYRAALDALTSRFFQKRVEHRYAKHFRGHLRTLHEPSTSRVLEEASPYLHGSFEGESVLSIGKSVDFAKKGVHGVVNTMPFGCMPGTIVTAMLRAVTRDYGMPVINVAYDGTESATTEIQLEAFMDQAKSRARDRSRRA